MGRRVHDEEAELYGVLAPVVSGYGVFKRGMYRLGIIAAAVRVLLGHLRYALVYVFSEIIEFYYIIVVLASVTVIY